MTIDLSIIVVHWNVPRLLDACLRSIAADVAGAGLSIETLVIDNDSASEEFEAVMRAHAWAQPIRLAENRGYASGCNAGLAQARGAAVLLLNPDTELLAGTLRRLWDTLWIATHIGMVAPLLLDPDGALQSHGYRFPGLVSMLFDLFPVHPRLSASALNGRVPLGDGVTPVSIDYPLGAALLVRRAAWKQIGPLDESYGMYCEEVDWCQRFRAAGWTILLAPAARVVHHAGQSTRQRTDAMHEALWLSRARYFGRWGTARQRRLLPPLVRARLARADRGADEARRASNARIRAAFARRLRASR